MRTLYIFGFILLLTLLCSSCGSVRQDRPVQRYHADAASLPRVRRIALFPIEPGPAPEESAELMKQTLAATLSRRYNVVHYHPQHAGIVQPQHITLIDDLLRAREKFGADAALMGEIIDYRRNDPPSVTMSLQLISTQDGSLIWAATGTVDSARPAIERRIRRYYKHTQESKRSLFGWRTMLLAERRYAQFVANEFLLTMNPQRRP